MKWLLIIIAVGLVLDFIHLLTYFKK